jgi:hypothetical protein
MLGALDAMTGLMGAEIGDVGRTRIAADWVGNGSGNAIGFVGELKMVMDSEEKAEMEMKTPPRAARSRDDGGSPF